MAFYIPSSADSDKMISAITGKASLPEGRLVKGGLTGRRRASGGAGRWVVNGNKLQNWYESAYGAFGKRMLDIVMATAILIIVLPFMVVIVFLVALDGANPFFVHQRVGLNGRLFGCLKIRTMVRDAEKKLADVLKNDPYAALEWQLSQKLSKDPRVTPLGQLLRKTSLDEVPQVWNVLRGEMSLVGPRPVVLEELERYGASKEAYMSVRPGITGSWQVEGRNSISYDVRVALDLAYVRSFSLMGDLRLMLLTGKLLFSKPTGV